MELLDYYTDGPKSREGVWVDQPGGGRLLIARMDNPRYKAILQEQRKRGGRRRPTDEETHEFLKEAVAKTVLLNWEGIELDGKAVKYNVTYAMQVFDALPTFLDTVVNQAYDEALFREDEVEDVVKQLRPTSGGTSSGGTKSSGSKK